MNSIKFVTFNGDGLGNELKLNKVVNWCRKYKPDVIFLQETHCIDIREVWYDKCWNDLCFHSIGASNARGASILISKRIDFELIEEILDDNGRYVVLDVVINNKGYLIGNYYGANFDCPEHLEEYLNLLIPNSGQEIISAGDYNFVMNVSLDKRGGRPRTHEKSRKLMTEWCQSMDVMDIWRIKNPNIFDYTWRSRFRPYVYCRLDFYIISSSLCNFVDQCTIKTSYMSDHRLVSLEIINSELSRGPGFWKFNNSLLSDKDYTQLITKTIQDTIIDNPNTAPTLLLDTIKCKIRGSSVRYCSYKKRLNKMNFENWSNELGKLESLLPHIMDDHERQQTTTKIEKLDGDIKILLDNSTKGYILRSKCQNYEEGERNSKYFYNLEKSNGNKKTILKLKTNEGIVTGQENVLKEQVKYYHHLYETKINPFDPGSRDKLLDLFFVEDDHPKINNDNVPLLNVDISVEEVFNILSSFQEGKSPGTDGLTKEFYVYFWEYINIPLINSFRYSLETGSLSMDQKRGIINLIPKKDKDTLILNNWRPLTLLNTDYKILAKLLATRLKATLRDFISDDQTGFVPDQYIGTNINRMLNFIDYCNDNGVEGMLISIDYEKAFDSMEWDFVYKALEYYGFPNKFINWIKILYNNIESCIINNGHISQFFRPTRGVRQGCPISPYLFIVGAEIMAAFVRNNNKIPPILITDKSSAISQYADDTNIITYRSRYVLDEIFHTMDMFAIVSGLKVNVKKTQVLFTGPNHYNTYDIESICKVTDTINILGIFVTALKADIIEKNYTPALEKIRLSLNLWSLRNLSLFGRLEIVRTLATSRLIYILSILPSPPIKFLEDIERILTNFVWKYSTSKIRKNVLKSKKDMGGADLVDIKVKDMSLKVAWINRLITLEGSWKDVVVKAIPIHDLEYFFKCNIHCNDLKLNLNINSIWNDVFRYWCKLNYKSIDYLNEASAILQSNLWLNSNMKIGKKLIFWKNWFDNGITIIENLFNVKTKEFYTYTELSKKYDIKGNTLHYLSILSSIPVKWKRLLKGMKDTNLQVHEDIRDNIIDTIIYNNKAAGVTYKMLVNDYNEQPYDRFVKWGNDVDMSIFDTDLEWYRHICDWYLCTRSVELKSFIYKYNMRFIATRKYLHTIGRSDTALCPKCNREVEDIVHMFWKCSTIQKLWKTLTSFINEILNSNINITKKGALMNINEVDITFEPLLSFICIVVIKTIYNNKDATSQITAQGIINVIKKYENIERNIAIKNKKLQNHFNKWLGFFTLWSK